MAYPALLKRLFNFRRDANIGLESPAPEKVDAELDNVVTVIGQMRDRLMAVTSADSRLRNVASALAQALVGTWSGNSDGTVTVTTTVPWQAAFSVNSVLVLVGVTPLRPIQITSVQDDGLGFLQLTLASAPVLGTTIVVWAFEPGAGILTRLDSTAMGEGASLIGIEDAVGLLDAGNVEDALAELAAEANALTNALGNIGTILRSDGSVAMTANLDMAGFTLDNLTDAVLDAQPVTLRQISTYIAVWTDLQRFYMKRDGTTAMAGNTNFGNNKGTNLADPDLAQPLDAVNVRAMLKAISTSGAAPVGTVIESAMSTPPSEDWLLCDGSAYSQSAYPVLAAGLSGTFKPPGLIAQGARVGQFLTGTVGLQTGINLTANVITTLPDVDPGVGYEFVPLIECENTDGGAAVTVQPTFTVVLTPLVTDGPNVTGGALSITLATGGAGIRDRAVLLIRMVRLSNPLLPAMAQLPSGFFRVPDRRGRFAVGAGIESKTPGIYNPPLQAKGDAYDATARIVGDIGGGEKHQLTVAELPRHHHDIWTGKYGGNITSIANDESGFATKNRRHETADAGSAVAHPNLPPFIAMNYYIKAQ